MIKCIKPKIQLVAAFPLVLQFAWKRLDLDAVLQFNGLMDRLEAISTRFPMI